MLMTPFEVDWALRIWLPPRVRLYVVLGVKPEPSKAAAAELVSWTPTFACESPVVRGRDRVRCDDRLIRSDLDSPVDRVDHVPDNHGPVRVRFDHDAASPVRPGGLGARIILIHEVPSDERADRALDEDAARSRIHDRVVRRDDVGRPARVRDVDITELD